MNDLFKDNQDIKNLFWEMLVIDFIINNNDRNKNNWGLLYNKDDKSYNQLLYMIMDHHLFLNILMKNY